MRARGRAAAVLLLLGVSSTLLAALGSAACVSRGPRPPRAPRAAARGAPATPPFAMLTSVTYVASLVHFVDSLAGASGGKTIPVYQALWSERFGPPSTADSLAVRQFLDARGSRTAQRRCGSPPPGAPAAVSGWRLHFLDRALAAPDLDGFLASVRPCLSEVEAQGLASALAHFRPGFDLFWREGGYLHEFQSRFEHDLIKGRLGGYLSGLARFFDVDPSGASPPVLCLVLLPRDGSTHAQAVGTRLLVEIRPGDALAPENQVSVVAHETSHYLFELMGPERLTALEARAAALGGPGRRTWRLLGEGLPTALGQGLAVARLAPRAFDRGGFWYHIPEIDRFAKRLYPIVRREIDAGRTIEGPFLEEAVKALGR